MSVAAIVFLASVVWILARIVSAPRHSATGVDIAVTGLAMLASGAILAVHALS